MQSEIDHPSTEHPAAPPVSTRRRFARWVPVAAGAFFVFMFSLWDLSSDLHRSGFHPDESRWINRAYYLRETLNPLSEVWADRYLIRGQPPMGSYIIGAGLLAQGRDLDTNGPWNFQYGFESNVTWNVSRGNMPADADVMAARRANLVIGATTALAIYLIVAQVTNVVGGLAGGLFMAINPLHHYLSTLSTSDAAFTCLVALAALAAMWLARNPTWWRASLLAIILAAGASTKLSPLVLAVGLSLFGIVLIIDPFLRQWAPTTRLWALISRSETGTERELGWRLLVQPAIVFALFILSYPYLWSAPIERTRILFDFRREEMANQAVVLRAPIHDRQHAIERTWLNISEVYSSIGRGLTAFGDVIGVDLSGVHIDMYLVVPGLVAFVYLAWIRGIASPTMVGLITIAGQTVLILGAIGVDFNRYYLPLLFTAAIGFGVLVGALGQLATWFYHRQAATTAGIKPSMDYARQT